MPFTVELTIRGLCMLVPTEPIQFGQRQRIGGMTVLMPDVRQARVIKAGDRTPIDLEVCAHLPLLRYPQPEENKLSSFSLLDGHKIEISDIASDSPLEIAPSFEKGTQMEKLVGPDKARVAPQFLDTLPTNLVGRMDLKAGTVEAFDSVGVWEFLPPPSIPYREQFLAAVRVSIPITQDQAELRLVARDGSGELAQVLRPKKNSGVVKLLLSNLCLEDEEHENRKVEGDFAVFYDLLDNYTGVLMVPHKGGGPNRGSEHGVIEGTATKAPACVFAIASSS